MRLFLPLFLLGLTAGCGAPAEPDRDRGGPASSPSGQEAAPGARPSPLPPVEPASPGTPGGLPDDRTPISEAPFSETSAQGAANVVQTYYALLGQEKFTEAWRLRSRGGGMSVEAFAAGFERYSEYHAQIGAPGPIEGAAGSLYVEVPVQLYGRLRSGAPFRRLTTVTLRRVNDVPGSTAEQRKWRIEKIEGEEGP